MATLQCCADCGSTRILTIAEAEYAARFGAGVSRETPAAAAHAAVGQRGLLQRRGNGRQPEPGAPICGNCGVNRVGRRRDGSWFPTCYSCG